MSTISTYNQDHPALAPYRAGGVPLGPWARIKLLWQAMSGRRLIYFIGILAMVFEAFFTFAGPMVIKVSIDSVLGEAKPIIPAPLDIPATWLLGPEYEGGGILPISLDETQATTQGWALRPLLRQSPWILALVFLASYLLQAIMSFFSGWCASMGAEHGAKQLRNRLHKHVLSLPWESLLRMQTGDWLQRCTSDVDTTRRFLSMQIFEILRTFVLISIALPVMLGLSAGLTAWGAVVIPIILGFSIIFYKKVQAQFLKVDQQEGILSGIIQENITGVRVVRAFARQVYETQRFSTANDQFRDKVYKLIVYLGWYWGVSSGLGLLQLGFVLAAGSAMVMGGSLSLGVLVLFMSYEQQLLWPIRQLGRLLADSGKVQVALGRMAEILAMETEKNMGGQKLLPGDIEFKNVSFTYPDGTKVLKDVSFTLPQGRHLAILGPTGSGKTSLVHLLLRLYEPDSGTILIGGRDISTISKGDLRATISMVLQESFIFGSSIDQNIRLGHQAASSEDIAHAAQSAAFHHTVEALEKGYDTTVGERGVSLSGGQRQRLSLSRALVRQAPILILDDSLSAVDTETDAKIRSVLRAQKATTILIAHRMTTLASADLILVLEHGQVTALGTHQELVEQEGLYQRLYRLQSELDDSTSPRNI